MAGQNPTAGGAMGPKQPGLGNIGQPQTPYTPPQNQPQPQPYQSQIPKWAQPEHQYLQQQAQQQPTPYIPPQNQPRQQPNLTQFGQQVQQFNQSGGNLSDYGRFIQQYNQPQQPPPVPPRVSQRPSSTELPYYQPGMSLPELARAGSEAGVTLGQLGQWGQHGPMQPPTPSTPPQNQPGFNLSEYGERIQALDQGNFSGGNLQGYGQAIQEFNRPYGQQQTPLHPPQNQPQQPNTAGKGSTGGSMQPQLPGERGPAPNPGMWLGGSPQQPQPGSVMDFGRQVRQFNAPQRPMPQLPQQGFGRWGQQRGMAGMFRNGGVVQQGNLQGVWDRPLQDKRSDWRSRRFMG